MSGLFGCAARVPTDIRTPEPRVVPVSAVRAAPERYLGTPVRWGGRILSVRNEADTTDIELLARPLDASGAPLVSDEAKSELGRFIARFRGFLDPAAYPAERLLTVAGVVAGVETRDVGDYPYRYPVVRATGKHLWPEQAAAAPFADPWNGTWYDPWYGRWDYGPWYGPRYGPFGPGYRPWYW
jgi:outer membrane lipoprotein